MRTQHLLAIALFAALIPCAAARAQTELERFERQLEQIRRETNLSIDNRVPAGQRALLDYGAFLSFNYLSLDDNTNDNHVLRQYDVIGYARVNLDGASEIFLRGRMGYRDFNDQDSFDGRGDEIIDPDLDRGYYRFDLGAWRQSRGLPPADIGFTVQGGRDLVYWGNGLALSEVLDGVAGSLSFGPTTLQLIAGITPVRTVDIDSSRPNFDHNTRRGFYGAMLTRDVGVHRPFVYGLVQRDYNEDDVGLTGGVTTKYDYNSYYLGLGSGGSITDKLLYAVEVVYEGGDTLSNSFAIAGPNLVQIPQTRDDIQAMAADARLDYLLQDSRRTRVSGEIIVASGDDDRLTSSTNTFGGNRTNTEDRAFNAFGLLNTGLAFAPNVSNVLIYRVGAVTFPLPDTSAFEKLQFGVDLFLFTKLASAAPIDEPTVDRRYLGWEPDVFINWQLTSDVTVALRYGVFFPGSGIVTDDKTRHFIGVGLTYAF